MIIKAHLNGIEITMFLYSDGDPSNYMPYFKRAAVYLAIGQVKKALPDLDKTVELKRDFHQVGIIAICAGSHVCSSL